VFAPWNSSAQKPYIDAIEKYPELAAYCTKMSPPARLRYRAQQRYKQGLERITWGMGERRRRILAYEQRQSV
jgi:hypothetical protein